MIFALRELRRLDTPAADTCHVWRIPVAPTSGSVVEVLEGSELARAARFRRQHDRERFESSHRALRHILAGYLERDPSQLRFVAADHGRPHLAVEGGDPAGV